MVYDLLLIATAVVSIAILYIFSLNYCRLQEKEIHGHMNIKIKYHSILKAIEIMSYNIFLIVSLLW